jgi:hypothetical protein
VLRRPTASQPSFPGPVRVRSDAGLVPPDSSRPRPLRSNAPKVTPACSVNPCARRTKDRSCGAKPRSRRRTDLAEHAPLVDALESPPAQRRAWACDRSPTSPLRCPEAKLTCRRGTPCRALSGSSCPTKGRLGAPPALLALLTSRRLPPTRPAGYRATGTSECRRDSTRSALPAVRCCERLVRFLGADPRGSRGAMPRPRSTPASAMRIRNMRQNACVDRFQELGISFDLLQRSPAHTCSFAVVGAPPYGLLTHRVPR